MTNEEAIKIIKNYDVNGCGYCHQGGDEVEEAFRMAISALENQKKDTAEVKPIVYGEWIRFKEFENGYWHIKCSRCGQYWSIADHDKTFKYCFNCGAKMKNESEEEE